MNLTSNENLHQYPDLKEEECDNLLLKSETPKFVPEPWDYPWDSEEAPISHLIPNQPAQNEFQEFPGILLLYF
jgi:hypothetical protein